MKILLAGGGTAGHCLPNLALLPKLKAHFSRIEYLGSDGGIEEGLATAAALPYHAVKTPKLVRGWGLKSIKNNLALPRSLAKAKKKCVQILLKTQPNVVFLKGGYVCLPVALACKKLKIPFLCHESDLTFGLCNRLCLPFASKVLTAFPQTASKRKNALFTGAPLREELFTVSKMQGKAKYGFHPNKPVLLIVGGSSGAQGLNQAVQAHLSTLLKTFQILHIVGKKNPLPKPQAGYFPLPYEKEMQYAYAAADFALSRAGANALFELIALAVPTLAIPLPTGRGDQKQNAKHFAALGAVLYAEELQASETLPTLLNDLIKKEASLKNGMLRTNLLGGNERIVKEILSVAKRDNP